MSSSPQKPGVDALEVLTQFGASALRAGNTAVRTRELMESMALKLGFDAIAVNLSLDSITASARYSGQWNSMIRMLGPPGINALRIGQLEQLAKSVAPSTAPHEIAARLKQSLYSVLIAAGWRGCAVHRHQSLKSGEHRHALGIDLALRGREIARQ